ncbi:unnamed protein product [Blepharisma stoltei]|uniref:RING-type domain-containing protein n=1 Tax=Blepharisma stoltei TaxID=1481888 RepID=A0AAU9JUH8_9CILI|nr:unnamed protein product [Blepharisma stoltei]
MIGSRLYIFGSILLTIIVITHTYISEDHFYSTITHIAKSRSILLVLFNFGIVICILFFQFLIYIFFQTLKSAETQHMQSQAIHHGFQLVMVLYMLDIEFDWVIAMHAATNIAITAWHALAMKRVEYLFAERYAKSAYVRMMILHILLIVIDYIFITLEINNKFYETLNVFLSYEYILMLFEILRSLISFLLNTFERIFKPEGWEYKASLLSITEFLFNVIALGIIIVELSILSRRSAMGIYFLDRAISSIVGIYKCFKTFISSRKLLTKIDKFKDATPEEIHAANDKCIFCLDHLTQAKKINCGHLFHYKCLRDYFQQSNEQHKCPTCRADIDEVNPIIQHKYNEQSQQKIIKSMMIEELPKGFEQGKVVSIGAVVWGLPQAVTYHRISSYEEEVKQSIEEINTFMIRFYQHPPDQVEDEVFEESKESSPEEFSGKIPKSALSRYESLSINQ